MRQILFRAWDKKSKQILTVRDISFEPICLSCEIIGNIYENKELLEVK